ncbi:MAG: TolB family protein [Bacillota bacterium]
MSGKNGHGNFEKKDNVFPIDDSGSRRAENSLEDLVRHMRSIRDSIPVNRDLHRELRAKLIDGTRNQAFEIINPLPAQRRKGWKYWSAAGSIFAFILIAVVFLVFRASGVKNLETGQVMELGRFWNEESPLVPAISPSKGFIVVERGGALLLLDRGGSQFAVVSPPPGTRYSSPSWSRDGRKLALVRDKGTAAEIIALDVSTAGKPADLVRSIEGGMQGASVLAFIQAELPVSGLAWSPDGETLAYSVQEDGQSRLYLTNRSGSNVLLCPGRNPAWSPDGNWIVVEGDGPDNALRLVDSKKGSSYSLGPGKSPMWNSDGYLMFVRTNIREKVLSYLPDGSPQFTVQRKTGEIRWIYLGRGPEAENILLSKEGGLSGANLLMAQDTPTGVEELQWLKSLELSGVRSPRTLFLDKSAEYEGLVEGDEGSLIISRNDGGTVSLVRVGLRKNTLKREGRYS